MDQAFLRDNFDYDPAGHLVWKKPHQGVTVGQKVCLMKRKDGRRSVRFRRDGKMNTYLNYRLIFLYHHGYLPKYIDHINRDKTDDRIENLRPTNHILNAHNVNLSKRNSSGATGVSEESGKWRVRVYRGKNYNGGLFEDFDEAVAAAKKLRNRLTTHSEPL